MTVLAADAAPEAAAGAGAVAGGAGAVAGSDPAKGVVLGIAIVLLWLACFCFFVAFEGQKLLGEQADTSGGGLVKAMIAGLAQKAQGQEAGGGA